MTLLGVVTIGQAPRTDITGELARYLPGGTEVLERGALDHLPEERIAALAPGLTDDTLVSALRNGRSVILDRQRLVPLLQEAIDAAEHSGADVTLVVCTGSFPRLAHQRPLLHADHLLVRGVAAIVGDDGPLGVVVPVAEQEHALGERWRAALGVPVLVDHADPYAPDVMTTVPAAVARLVARGAHLTLLDCMGFTEAMRTAAARAAGSPVLLARAVAGRLTAELLSAQPRSEEGMDALAAGAGFVRGSR